MSEAPIVALLSNIVLTVNWCHGISIWLTVSFALNWIILQLLGTLPFLLFHMEGNSCQQTSECLFVHTVKDFCVGFCIKWFICTHQTPPPPSFPVIDSFHTVNGGPLIICMISALLLFSFETSSNSLCLHTVLCCLDAPVSPSRARYYALRS